jgi:CHAT domain-containing protein
MQIAREKNEPNAPRLALEAVERSRSRVLLDSVRGAFGSAGPDERHNQVIEEVRKLALEADLKGDEAIQTQTISERLAELRRLRGLQQAGAASEASTQPAALPVTEIESYFATGDALLLEFFLGEERSYVWAVGGGRFEVHELAPQGEIEEQIRRTFALLTARQEASVGPLRERARRIQEKDGAFYREAVFLSRALLGPIEGIDRFKRLFVVSDGALNYLPLGVLAHPARSGSAPDTYVPLISTHEVVRAPSVTSMLALQARASGRGSKSDVAVLADPVFTADDTRLTLPGESSAPPKEELSEIETNLRGSGRTLASLSRLLGSREELAAIAQIAPATAIQATGFMVDRTTAERVLKEPHRVVHFATHGVANDRYPELSSIVLSLFNEKGLPQDGFLRVQDISGMSVDADLVVLSACETALGHLIRGEGITGLVTAFLRAGARGVVASKWKVDDLATQQLMEEFYRGLLLQGMDAAAALRAAQVASWKRDRTKAPFHWGAFELHGIP